MRAVNCAGAGTYDEGGAGQSGSRDAGNPGVAGGLSIDAGKAGGGEEMNTTTKSSARRVDGRDDPVPRRGDAVS